MKAFPNIAFDWFRSLDGRITSLAYEHARNSTTLCIGIRIEKYRSVERYIDIVGYVEITHNSEILNVAIPATIEAYDRQQTKHTKAKKPIHKKTTTDYPDSFNERSKFKPFELIGSLWMKDPNNVGVKKPYRLLHVQKNNWKTWLLVDDPLQHKGN